MMNWSVSPVHAAANSKKSGAKRQYSGQKPAPDGFLALLEEMSENHAVSRQDGFSKTTAPRQQTEKDRELEQLQRRIQHVNGMLMSYMSAMA